MCTYFSCVYCDSTATKRVSSYTTIHNGDRDLYGCNVCGRSFSETAQTAMYGLKSSISKVASVLKLRGEGLGVRATGRVMGIHKNTVVDWERRFVSCKDALMLYAFCHEFIKLTFEADELYTIVDKKTKAHASKGWTAIILDRTYARLIF